LRARARPRAGVRKGRGGEKASPSLSSWVFPQELVHPSAKVSLIPG